MKAWTLAARPKGRPSTVISRWWSAIYLPERG